jgi:hypothetical protein
MLILWVKKIHTTDKNTDVSLAASKECVVDKNACKTKYMVRYLQQNAGRNKYSKRDDSPFEILDAF